MLDTYARHPVALILLNYHRWIMFASKFMIELA